MNRNIFLWAFYDFANSPLGVAIGGLYLGQWLVLDNHLDDIWYGLVFALATFILLLTAPFWGAWSDKVGKRMPFISQITIILVLLGFLLSVIVNLPLSSKVLLVLTLFFFLQYGYQLSLVFYDALLQKISTSKTIGTVSGIGDAVSNSGWIIIPIVLLPFATGKIVLFGEPGRSQVFLPAFILFALLVIPTLFFFKEPKTKIKTGKTDLKTIYQTTLTGMKNLIRKDKNVTLFLIAFMFASDAILTAVLYFAIFLDQAYKITDTQKTIVLVLAFTAAAGGDYFVGKLADKYGIKRVLIISCSIVMVTFSLMALLLSVDLLYLLAVLTGIGLGGFYITTRALMVKISPVQSLGEYFGFYATFQKFASIIGPLIWGGVTLFLKDYGPVRYRIAVLAMVFLMLIGTLLLTRVKEARQAGALV